jgi:hypothetical protein
MALVTPLLFLILFGIIDFGRMLNAQITLTEAAREGARAVALGYAPEPLVAAASPGMETAIDAETCPDGVDPEARAEVVVSHPFQPVTPIGSFMELFGGQADGSLTVTGTGVMPCVG